MITFMKALSRCKPPVTLELNQLKWIIRLHKLGLYKYIEKYYLGAYHWHKEQDELMMRDARLFIAYDGAFECAGRDTDEFIYQISRGIDESLAYMCGKVSPRVEMCIAFEDPEKYPYYYVKWKTLINIFKIKTHVVKHEPWIWFSLALISLQALTLVYITR